MTEYPPHLRWENSHGASLPPPISSRAHASPILSRHPPANHSVTSRKAEVQFNLAATIFPHVPSSACPAEEGCYDYLSQVSLLP